MEIPYTVEARPDTGLYNAKLGIWLFLASEVMLFGALFSSYVLLRTGDPAAREAPIEHGAQMAKEPLVVRAGEARSASGFWLDGTTLHQAVASALLSDFDLIGYLFREVLDGRNESLTDGVQRALGREPRDFGDYVRDAASAGAWER